MKHNPGCVNGWLCDSLLGIDHAGTIGKLFHASTNWLFNSLRHSAGPLSLGHEDDQDEEADDEDDDDHRDEDDMKM